MRAIVSSNRSVARAMRRLVNASLRATTVTASPTAGNSAPAGKSRVTILPDRSTSVSWSSPDSRTTPTMCRVWAPLRGRTSRFSATRSSPAVSRTVVAILSPSLISDSAPSSPPISNDVLAATFNLTTPASVPSVIESEPMATTVPKRPVKPVSAAVAAEAPAVLMTSALIDATSRAAPARRSWRSVLFFSIFSINFRPRTIGDDAPEFRSRCSPHRT